ncbi:uncharacterized protein LOC129316783 [Prosopis cineraria]|uniref:uncharacterized protein LOC129316783 n=1 Tax=Prosopis cineraria TaxID=364024 RepID=UPI002410A694|nr:uncharacterized protein LOC129316783 [Prosopis cineraria]
MGKIFRVVSRITSLSRSLVTNIWGDFIKGVGKKINSSRNTYFWWENWAPLDQPLIYYTVRQHNSFNYSESISHHVLPNGQWNINKWVHVLPRWVIEKLKKTKPLDGQEKDQFRWRANNDGLFSVKEAYKFIQNTRHSTLEPLWKKIWRWPVSKRIKFFFWIGLNGILQVNQESLAIADGLGSGFFVTHAGSFGKPDAKGCLKALFALIRGDTSRIVPTYGRLKQHQLSACNISRIFRGRDQLVYSSGRFSQHGCGSFH